MSAEKPKKNVRAGKPRKRPAPKAKPLSEQEREEATLLAGLTPMQAAFVGHYVIEKNATEAAKKAGYSEKTAYSIGSENLKKPEIRSAIDERFRHQNERLDFRADRAKLELARMLDVDIARAYDDQGNLLPIKQIPEDVRRCIESIEAVEELGPPDSEGNRTPVTVRKIKFVSRKATVELALKHFGELKDKVEHTHAITLEKLLDEAYKDEG